MEEEVEDAETIFVGQTLEIGSGIIHRLPDYEHNGILVGR